MAILHTIAGDTCRHAAPSPATNGRATAHSSAMTPCGTAAGRHRRTLAVRLRSIECSCAVLEWGAYQAWLDAEQTGGATEEAEAELTFVCR